MDRFLRKLKRRAAAGDEDALEAWFKAAFRSGVSGIKEIIDAGYIVLATQEIEQSEGYVYNNLYVIKRAPAEIRIDDGWEYVVVASGSISNLDDSSWLWTKTTTPTWTRRPVKNLAVTTPALDPSRRLICSNCDHIVDFSNPDCPCGQTRHPLICPYCGFEPLQISTLFPYNAYKCVRCKHSFNIRY